MSKIKNWIFAIIFATVAGGMFVVAVPTTNTTYAAVNCSGTGAFLTFPAWYRGVATPNAAGDGCDISTPGSDKLGGFIWRIVLNAVDIGLQLVGYVSVGFILYGGFLFLTSSGEAAGIAKAKTTITNAVIGLVISLASIAIVNLIFGVLFGKGNL